MHFQRQSAVSAKFTSQILHFQRQSAVSAKFSSQILHFQRQSTISAKFTSQILHFQRQSAISAKSLAAVSILFHRAFLRNKRKQRFSAGRILSAENRRFLSNSTVNEPAVLHRSLGTDKQEQHQILSCIHSFPPDSSCTQRGRRQ